MIHVDLRWMRRCAVALGLGVAFSAAMSPVVAAAEEAGKKKPPVASKKQTKKSAKPTQKTNKTKTKAAVKSLAPSARPNAAAPDDAINALVASKGARAAASGSVGDRMGLRHTDDPLNLSSNAALVIDQNTREVLLSKNDKAVMPIASITKLMTGLLVADARLPMDEEITITQQDVDTYKGTGSRLAVGTRLTRGELMHLALMSSENRAAHALGRTYPGGIQQFVRLMNQKANELGMRDTRYVEPTGLSSDNQSSAHDLALLVTAAYQRPLLRELTTSPSHSVDAGRRVLQFRNSNRLIDDPQWDIGLQKTGYISEAGRCVVMSVSLAGRQVVMVFLDAAGKAARIGDAQRVRRWLEDVVQSNRRDPSPQRRG